MQHALRQIARVGLALLLAACATQGERGPQHTPSGHAVPLPGADFSAYVATARTAIAEANRAARRPLDEATVVARGPFELAPSGRHCPAPANGRHARAALLLHDLAETPYEMRALARRLADDCYLVRAILLPGHGTVAGDLLTVDERDWLAATRLGIESLAGRAERVDLVGHGLGGALALHAALFSPPPPGLELGGLVLLAPAIRAPTSATLVAQAGAMPGGFGGAWRAVHLELDPVGYESIPRAAEAAASRLAAALDAQDGPLERPVFVVLAADDPAVDAAAVRAWFCRRLIGPRELLWYTRAPQPVTDCRFVEEIQGRADPAILDLAGRGLPVAPDDPILGADGRYFDCRHYYFESDSPDWLLCMDPAKTPANSSVRYGVISEQNLATHIVRQLTYNPDFEAMTAALVAFLDGLE